MRSTIPEAPNSMRRLHPADAGRLRGMDPHLHSDKLSELTRLAETRAKALAALIAARDAGTITADTPKYVVCSDELPVAWLTVHAAVVTPDTALTPNQAKHQRLAVGALGDLHRHTLRELAGQRDRREGRRENDEAEYDEAMVGALRVAPATDPTRTTRVRVDADLTRSNTMVTAGLRGADTPTLIISANGYGHHRAHADWLALDAACAMHAVAVEHQVSLASVGDWIDAEEGLAGAVTAQTLPQRFRDAYLGRYTSRDAYARHRMDAHGWTVSLTESGMEPFFDQRGYQHHVFTREVTGIGGDRWRDGAGIEAFRRPQ